MKKESPFHCLYFKNCSSISFFVGVKNKFTFPDFSQFVKSNTFYINISKISIMEWNLAAII